MRNLKTIALQETTLPTLLPLTATAWDTNDNSVICAFGPTVTRPLIELKRKKACADVSQETNTGSLYEIITSWDAPCPLPDLEHDEILLLQYFADTATACLILAGGDIVVVREEPTTGQEKIEIVGSVDAGIAAAAWAPDEEVLTVVTRSDTLILMSRDFEPLAEANLTPEDLKASKHVSVGWGKKETQFQGKRAKALRDPTMPESVDEGKPSPCDDGRVSISWRGDGAYFAVNCRMKDERRAILVFTREAVLDSASEPVDGLESTLTWRPAGNLLAGIQRHKTRVHVIFFERNGLRHGEFALRLTEEEMESWGSSISLSWNANSSVLAVAFADRVQFWTMGNYHYYLKQEIITNPSKSLRQAVNLRWLVEQPLRCAISTPETLLDLEYSFAVSRGSLLPPYDHGCVAVIDGSLLKLTPLRQANVPPPMSFCEISVSEGIVDCAISKSSHHLAILTKSTIEIYRWHDLTANGASSNGGFRKDYKYERLDSNPTLQQKYFLNTVGDTNQLRFTQIMFCGEDDILIIAVDQQGAQSQSVLLSRSEEDSKFDKRQPTEALVGCRAAVVDVTHHSLWAQRDGAMEAISGPYVGHRLQGYEADTAIVRLETIDSWCRVSLSKKGELFANARLLARDCTSFIVTAQHLIFTTKNHFLKFVHLNAEIEQLGVPEDTPEADERCRIIERGAILITAIPSTYAVVLQMPRGNLETIFPRVLVVAGIRGHLLEKDYKKAFLACQSHQVDLNLLHDYSPATFLENIELFMDQVKKPSRVDEFLSKLKEEDVSQTMYKDTLYAFRHDGNPPAVQVNSVSTSMASPLPEKVNGICDAFISTIHRKDPSRYQNLITAYVSKKPSDFISALSLISEIRKNDSSASEKAISHLVFLSDATRLYTVALSSYDLELTVSIAEHAQMDPREYLPFLERLHALGPLQRQYEVDHFLKNYAKALRWLHAQDKHEEVESYMMKHDLYTTALGLYKYSPALLKNVTQRYAVYLGSQSRFLDAAIAFESLEDHQGAYKSYALAHRWQEALACASLVPLDEESLRVLATSLATTLTEETRDYRSAAIIHIQYLQDITAASRLLCKGSYFAEATRVLALHKQANKFADIIDVGLTEKFGEIVELLADCKGQLNSQVPRIQDLRIKKLEDPLAFFGGDPTRQDGEGDVPDDISLAATNASTAGGQSLFTRYGSNHSKFGGTMASNVSHKTSKTKRREERKRARGKKGSVYEEEYLVASVVRLIERVNGMQDEVKRLTEGLLKRNMRERAIAVDERMAELVSLCELSIEKLWQSGKKGEEIPDEGNYEVNGDGRPRGGEGVLWDSQMESQGRKEVPVVKPRRGAGLLT